MDSDSDPDMFITQNSFRNVQSADSESDTNLLDLLPAPKERKKYKPLVSDISDAEIEEKVIYKPIASDISDEELVQASIALEEQEKVKHESKPSTSRFAEPVDDTQMADIGRRRLADSTEKKIKWAFNLFNQWLRERNTRAENEPQLNISPIYVQFSEMTKDELNYSISRFLCEVRKVNGEDYPGETLHEIVICLQLYFELKGTSYKFLSDPMFLELKNTLDRKMQERAQAGIGINRRQAQQITLEEEAMLWKNNVLGSQNPKQLLNTLIYLIGLNFALRGGEEHRSLRWTNSQLQLLTDSDGANFLRYTEDCSKTRRGGLKHRMVKPKVVDAYENKRDRQKCLVTLYNKYVYHCPDKKPENAFYLRPLAKPTGRVWFAAQAVGRHTLSKVVADICSEGGLTGHRTNHSLRASAACRLYDNEVDEQLIQEVTGHRSAAVRKYKRTNQTLKRKVNALVQGRAPVPASVLSTEDSKVERSNKHINRDIAMTA